MSDAIDTNKALDLVPGGLPEDLAPFVTHVGPGVTGNMQARLRFPNQQGASVIVGGWAYGLELAVLVWDSPEADEDAFDLDYSTPITDDVLGWLSAEELISTLRAIKALPAAKELES